MFNDDQKYSKRLKKLEKNLKMPKRLKMVQEDSKLLANGQKCSK